MPHRPSSSSQVAEAQKPPVANSNPASHVQQATSAINVVVLSLACAYRASTETVSTSLGMAALPVLLKAQSLRASVQNCVVRIQRQVATLARCWENVERTMTIPILDSACDVRLARSQPYKMQRLVMFAHLALCLCQVPPSARSAHQADTQSTRVPQIASWLWAGPQRGAGHIASRVVTPATSMMAVVMTARAV